MMLSGKWNTRLKAPCWSLNGDFHALEIRPGLGRHIAPTVPGDAKVHARSVETPGQRAQPFILAIEEKGAPVSESLQNLRLGLGDVVQRAEKLEMYRGHVRNHGYIGLTDQRKSPDLPGMMHAQFYNGDFIIILEAKEAEWNSEVIVQVAGRFAHLIPLPQESRREAPCRGFTHATGHGHQRPRPLFTSATSQFLQGQGGVAHSQEKSVRPLKGSRKRLRVNHHPGTLCDRLVYEIMAVEA